MSLPPGSRRTCAMVTSAPVEPGCIGWAAARTLAESVLDVSTLKEMLGKNF